LDKIADINQFTDQDEQFNEEELIELTRDFYLKKY
jgi:hypothetical protein